LFNIGNSGKINIVRNNNWLYKINVLTFFFLVKNDIQFNEIGSFMHCPSEGLHGVLRQDG
jgi:hypothetical protein